MTLVVLVQSDVANEEEFEAMFGQTLAEVSSLDVLLNKAGVQKRKGARLSRAAIQGRNSADSKRRGTPRFARVPQKLSPPVRARPFAISWRATAPISFRATPAFTRPCQSQVRQLLDKQGRLKNMTRTLVIGYAGRGIRVNVVGSGAVVTTVNRAWIDNARSRREVANRTPMGRSGALKKSRWFSPSSGSMMHLCNWPDDLCPRRLTLYLEFRVARSLAK